jgi:hypothetical protein
MSETTQLSNTYLKALNIRYDQWNNQDFFHGVSTNSFEDRGQREQVSGGGSPIVRGSNPFANE